MCGQPTLAFMHDDGDSARARDRPGRAPVNRGETETTNEVAISAQSH
jgi:hypothetical protein